MGHPDHPALNLLNGTLGLALPLGSRRALRDLNDE
jgi:hypothetical protein